MKRKERVRQLLEKVDRLDAGNLARFECVVDGVLQAQGKETRSRVAMGMAAYWFGILMAGPREEPAKEGGNAPTGQTSHPENGMSFQDNTPWRAEGRKVLDCDGNLVATVTDTRDVSLLTTAPRLAACVSIGLDWHTHWLTGQRCARDMDKDVGHFYQSCRQALEQAGQTIIQPAGDWTPLNRPETPIEWANEHLATMTRAWNKLWSALALWPQTDRCRVIPECKRKRIAGHMRAMVGQQDKIRMELEP